MLWMILAALVAVLLVVFVLCARLHIYLALFYTEEEQSAHVLAELFGIPVFEKNQALAEAEEGQADMMDHLSRMMKMLKKARNRNGKFLKKIKLKTVTWETKVGTGQAATSGLAGGGIWAAKGMAIGPLLNNVQMKGAPQIQVETDYYREIFESELRCMATITVGQAIYAYMSSSKK